MASRSSACSGLAVQSSRMPRGLEAWTRNRFEPTESQESTPVLASGNARRAALTLMVMASAAALLATSDPEKHSLYRFQTSSDGPRATLSARLPQVHYRVRVRVLALGPEGIDTTSSALATVHGAITSNASEASSGGGPGSASAGLDSGSDADSTRPTVRVSFGSSTPASDAVFAQTSFQLSRSLVFAGDCARPAGGSPCQAEVELDFDLQRAGTLVESGSVDVDWSIDFESRAFKPQAGGSDEKLAAPWTVELVEIGDQP